MLEVVSNANQEVELELTYLAREIPTEIEGVEPVQMEDTYFPEDPSIHAQLRVRRKDDSYVVMKKVPVTEGDASAQIETSISITKLEYDSISSGSQRKIIKDRYLTTINGYPAEVDVFKGSLSGLVLIDFEFKSAEEKDAFEPPAVCGADVTNEHLLAAGELSSHSYEAIARELGRLGYLRLEIED